MGKFIIKRDKSNDFRFNLLASNNQIILISEGYSTKQACMNGIYSVIENAKEESNFDKRISSNGKYYFNLKASNGQIIGTSELYESQAGRENGIYAVQHNAQNRIVEE